MTHVLSDANLLLGSLPASWAPSLAELHALDALIAVAQRDGANDQHRANAAQLRSRLVSTLAPLSEPLPARLHADGSDFRHWFAEAVLLFGSFATAGGELLIDTVGESTLAGYPLDYQPSAAGQEHWKRALAKLHGWTAEELDALEQRLARVSANLAVKRGISQALAAFVREHAAGDDRAGALRLMLALYGVLPWRADDVDLVLTTTSVFLCVPYQGETLVREGYAQRPAFERERIGRFLARVDAARQSLKSVRFPAFGLFDEAEIADGFMAQLTEWVRRQPGLAAIHERVVADTLRTMVIVLPTHELAKYLVHDAFGHGWQESLCEFEWTFQDMPRLVDPLRAGASFGAGSERLAAAFEARDGRTSLRSDELLRVVEADVRGRIRVGINLVVSESLADLIEHKLTRAGTPLPSSSLLPGCPLRLDLSIMDARSMVRALRRPYRALARPEERARLTAELVALGLPEAGCEQAIAEAHALIDRAFALAFDDRIELGSSDGALVATNVLQRIVLGIAGFDAAVERFVERAEDHYRGRRARAPDAARYECPVACIDLLVLLLGGFYERERELHVWHLDELLNDALFPALLELEAALDQTRLDQTR